MFATLLIELMASSVAVLVGHALKRGKHKAFIAKIASVHEDYSLVRMAIRRQLNRAALEPACTQGYTCWFPMAFAIKPAHGGGPKLTVTSMASPILRSGNSHRSPLRCSSRSSLRRNEALANTDRKLNGRGAATQASIQWM